MAEENITEVQRKLSEAMLQVQTDLAKFGQVTQQSAEQLKDAQMKATFGSESYTKGVNAAGQALGALAGAGIESTKAMYQGKKDATAFNASLGELSKAAVLAGTALTMMMPGGIIMKGIIAAVTMFTGAVIATVQAANEMNSKLYKGYEGLQKSGGAASDGMTGVYKDAKKLGISMDELDSMVSLVAESSKDLTLFGGTVADGRRKLADMAQASEASREGFFKLGISQQAQNESMTGYMKLQARTGNMQKQTTDQLAASARNYITEQDQLARITGMGAKEQQKVREDALMEEQFLAKVRQLQREGKHAEAKELQDANILMSAMGDEVGKGYRAIVNGNLRDENARKFQMATQGKGLEAAQKLSTGQIKAAEAAQLVGKGMQGYLDSQGDQLAQLGVAGQSATNYAQVVKGAAMSQEDYNKTLEKAQADQATTLAGKGDAKTAEEARQIKERQNLNKKAEDAIFKNIESAQAVNAKLLGTTDTLIDAFGKLTGAVNKVLNFFGFGPVVNKVDEKQAEISGVETELKTAQAKQKTAKTPEEIQAADREVKYYTEKIALLKEEKEAIAKKETNAAYEKEVLKRADDEVKIKTAAYDKTMATASMTQHMGIGLDADQTAARKEMLAASHRERMIREDRSGSEGGKRAAAVADLKKSGYKPPSPGGAAGPASSVAGGSAPAPKSAPSEAGGSAPAPKSASGPEQHSSTGGGGQGGKVELAQVTSKTGKTASVNKEYASKFQGIIDYLDGVGYDIYSLGGYVDRDVRGQPGVKSVHAHGAAIDINPKENPFGSQRITDMPEGVGKVASDLGLGWGANWKSVKDAMHFSAAKNEGGSVQLSEGGVAVGPNSGYPATLHGEEAVIPLNNSGGNFVKVFEDMAMMMGKQVGAMDELIRVAKNGNDIQTKLLRVQQ